MKMYVTFGQVHVHSVGGRTFDKDCVAVIRGESAEDCDRIAWEIFDGKFHRHCPEGKWDMEDMKYFPRGLIEVEANNGFIS